MQICQSFQQTGSIFVFHPSKFAFFSFFSLSLFFLLLLLLLLLRSLLWFGLVVIVSSCGYYRDKLRHVMPLVVWRWRYIFFHICFLSLTHFLCYLFGLFSVFLTKIGRIWASDQCTNFWNISCSSCNSLLESLSF